MEKKAGKKEEVEIDVREQDGSIDKIRFADDGVISIIDNETFEFVSDCNIFPFGLDEVDNMIKALQKIRNL